MATACLTHIIFGRLFYGFASATRSVLVIYIVTFATTVSSIRILAASQIRTVRPNGMLKYDGISWKSKWRALTDLERRGLITVVRRRRKSPIVRVLVVQP
jgi:hypothetical protein